VHFFQSQRILDDGQFLQSKIDGELVITKVGQFKYDIRGLNCPSTVIDMTCSIHYDDFSYVT